jgi:hypothetical protein
MSDHWLARPSTIRLLWRGFIVVLVLTVLTELVVGGAGRGADKSV